MSITNNNINCNNCGAPLPDNNHCGYCKSRHSGINRNKSSNQLSKESILPIILGMPIVIVAVGLSFHTFKKR